VGPAECGVTAAVVDLFAGAGGWDEGLRALGLTDVVGLEWNKDACATAEAAGHRRIQADIARISTERFVATMVGLTASPPCTKFSPAGNGSGRRVLDVLAAGIRSTFSGEDVRQAVWDAIYPSVLAEAEQVNAKRPKSRRTAEKLAEAARRDTDSIALVLEPARFIADALAANGPLDWATLEQVPSVLPLWEVYRYCLRTRGWSVWTGVLNSADYGVPQTRERAILLASRSRQVGPPVATHARKPEADVLFGNAQLPWVSMSDALGWPSATEVVSNYNSGGVLGNPCRRPASDPSFTVTGKMDRTRIVPPADFILDRRQNSRGPRGTTVPVAPVSLTRPAPTITSQVPNAWVLRATSGGDELKLSIEETSVLQSFPADYPWHGTKGSQFLQVGNAVPPALAAVVVSAAAGLREMAVAA
jgi:DNA (cytosine-5)-methyltransferase 1